MEIGQLFLRDLALLREDDDDPDEIPQQPSLVSGTDECACNVYRRIDNVEDGAVV
jgi:hypothetical protein